MVGTVFLTLGASGLAALMDFGATYLDYSAIASAGVSLLIVALIALAVVLLVAMAYWFAPALVVLNGEPPIAALQKSFAASWRNFGAFLLYGLIYIGLRSSRRSRWASAGWCSARWSSAVATRAGGRFSGDEL